MSRGKSFVDKAISYYIDSYVEFHDLKNDLRYDSFIIKLHIAFTSLFLEIYKNTDSKKYKSGMRKKELGLTRLLNLIQDIDEEWKKDNENDRYMNLVFLIERRDSIVHENTSINFISYEEKLMLNATFRNFYLTVKKHFPKKSCDKIPEMLQLFTYIEESQFTDPKDKKGNAKFLQDFLKKYPNCNKDGNLGFPSFNATDIIFLCRRDDKKLHSDKPRITVSQVNNPEVAQAVIKMIIDNDHNLTPQVVCDDFNNRTQAKNPNGKPLLNTAKSFPKVRKYYGIENEQKYYRVETLNPDTGKKKEQPRYSKRCIDFLVQEYNKDSDFFKKIAKGLKLSITN